MSSSGEERRDKGADRVSRYLLRLREEGPLGGKKVEVGCEEESRPICSRVCGRLVAVMWPVALGSRTSKDSRMLCNRVGGREE